MATEQEAPQSTILIRDDTPRIWRSSAKYIAVDLAGARGQFRQARLQIAGGETPPDLILLDVMMPEMDGFDVIVRLKGDPKTAEIPVIFVTAMDGTEDEERGLDHGAVDHITKPLRPAIVRARAHPPRTQARQGTLRDENVYLEAEVARRMRQNQIIQEVSIHALARLAETRDPETGNHLRRTQGYVRTLADALRNQSALSRLPATAYRRTARPLAARHRQGRHPRTTSCSSPAN